MRRLLIAAGAVLAFLATGFGVAYATIPGGDGTIAGCYHNSTGALRVIDGDTETCPSGYTALNWDQVDTDTHGLTGIVRVEDAEQATVPNEGLVEATAVCPSGKVLLSGGASKIQVGAAHFELTATQPNGTQQSWRAGAENASGVEATGGVTAYAVCADPYG